MARDGSGVYSLPAGNPVVSLTTITAAWGNSTLSDIGNELTNSIDKNGRTVPAANLPMGGFVHTGAGDGAANGQYLTYGQATTAKLTGGLQLNTGAAATPSYSFISNTDMGMYRTAANILAWSTQGVERLRLGAAGELYRGYPAGSTNLIGATPFQPAVQSHGTSLAQASEVLGAWANSTTSPSLILAKSRGAAIGTHAVVQTNDPLGRLAANGSDGTAFVDAARIEFVVDAVPAAGDVNSNIRFVTKGPGSPISAKLTLTSDGRLYGAALHDNPGSVTGATTQYIASGTYAPAVSPDVNVAAAGYQGANWLRVGNVVTVQLTAIIDPTAASTASAVTINLPIASTFSTTFQAAGVGIRADNTLAPLVGFITSVVAGNAIRLQWFNDANVANKNWSITFQYEVL